MAWIWLPFTVGILFALVYTVIVSRQGREITWNWWHRLVSTLVSVLIGVSVTLAIFHYQQSLTRAKERARLVTVLESELSDELDYLTSGEQTTITSQDKQYSFLITRLHPQTLVDAAKSGLFDEVTTLNLFRLSRKMEVYDVEVEHVLHLVSTSTPGSSYEWAQRNMNESKAAIISDIGTIRQVLKRK